MCGVRDKDPEPDDSVIAPVNKADLQKAAMISIAQRERDLAERLLRVSIVK